jgi:hypothetical protein
MSHTAITGNQDIKRVRVAKVGPDRAQGGSAARSVGVVSARAPRPLSRAEGKTRDSARLVLPGVVEVVVGVVVVEFAGVAGLDVGLGVGGVAGGDGGRVRVRR